MGGCSLYGINIAQQIFLRKYFLRIASEIPVDELEMMELRIAVSIPRRPLVLTNCGAVSKISTVIDKERLLA